MINETKIRPYFFMGLLAIAGLLLFFIFKPFFSALLLAGALAIIFQPIHQFFLKRLSKTPSIATLLTLFVIVLMVIVPLTFLSGQLFMEAKNFYSEFSPTGGESSALNNLLTNFNNQLANFAPFVSIDVTQIQKEIINWVANNFNLLFAGALKTALNVFIFLFALFYLIRDGKMLKQGFVALSPLENSEDNQIFLKLRTTINSVIMGSVFIAIIQGILTALGFAIFGVNQPVLWGSFAALLALIPGIGATLIFIPAILIKLILGETISALGLVLWGLIAVSPIDNILRPMFIERGMKVHPFLILISVIGGLTVFGPIGFLLGPIVLSLFFALTSIYLEVIKGPSAKN